MRAYRAYHLGGCRNPNILTIRRDWPPWDMIMMFIWYMHTICGLAKAKLTLTHIKIIDCRRVQLSKSQSQTVPLQVIYKSLAYWMCLSPRQTHFPKKIFKKQAHTLALPCPAGTAWLKRGSEQAWSKPAVQDLDALTINIQNIRISWFSATSRWSCMQTH